MRAIALFLLFFCLTISTLRSQIIVNEFSNGTSGSKEFIELAVVGNPGDLVDIRNWIVDDHSGYFGCASGNGIAPGHIRFANIANWACVPAGSLILIYNASDPNTAITAANDYTDSNNDRVYILDIGGAGAYLEANTGLPSSGSCNTFTGPYSPASGWNAIALGNGADVAQTVDPNNTASAFHAAGYGGISGPTPAIYFSGSGSGKNFSFVNTVNNDYNSMANWSSGSAATNDTPGAPNNTANANWLNSFQASTTVNTTSGCAPLAVNFTTSNTTAGNTYTWNFGDGNSASTATANHTYTSSGTFNAVLTITTPAGCSFTETTVITVSPGGAISAPALNDVCENEPAFTLPQGTPAGGNWSGNGVSGNVFNPAIATVGTHTLTYSITGACGGNDATTITVNASPTANFTMAATNFCETNTAVNLTSGTPAGGNYIGNGISGNSFTPSLAGVGTHALGYVVTQNGCSDTAYQNVTVSSTPVIAWNLPDTACTNAGPLFIGGAQPTGGQYSVNGVAIAGDSYDFSSLPVNSTAIVEYSVANGTCSANDQQNIYVNAVPTVTITASNDTILCKNEPITLLANGTSNVVWSTGATLGSISPTQSGTFWVRSENSCGIASDTQLVEFIDLPTLDLNIGDTSLCQGDEILLKASFTGNLTWNHTTFSPDSFWVNVPNAYIATASNSCGSVTDTAYIAFEQAQVEIDILNQSDLSVDFEAVPTNYRDYTWLIEGNSINAFAFHQHQFAEFGTHPVIVRAETDNGCLAFDTILVELNDRLENLFIPNVFTPNGDGLNDYFQVVGTEAQKFHAAIFNRWGTEIASWDDLTGSWDGTLDGTDCAEGTYILRVVHDEKNFIKTITLLR